MSTRPGIRSLARGAVLALAAAMAFATFGCQQSTDSESDDEQVDEVALPIAPVGKGVGDDQPGGNGSQPGRGGEQMNDDEDSGEPEPQPWIDCGSSQSSKPGPNPVDPSTKSTAVVSPTGHH